jgi:hypothetical protein
VVPTAASGSPGRAHARTSDADAAPSRRATALTPTAVARAGVLAFVALVALEHPLRPDLPATRHFVSEYASGSTDPIARIAFLAWGVGIAALALGLWRARARVTALLLGVAAAGTPLAAAFATVTVGGELPVGDAYTTAGRLHDLGASMLFFGLLLAAAASLRRLSRPRYRWGVAGLAACLLLAPAVLVALGRDWPGIGQRAFILVGCGWLLLAAAETARLTTRGRRTPAPG